MRKLFPFVMVVLTMPACTPKKLQPNKYPLTKRVDSVDTYYGENVPDPYRWLENDTTKETAEWMKNQNGVTFAYFNGIPYRDKIKKRMEAMYSYERLSAPFKEGDYYYFYKNSGLQNHNVLFRKKGPSGASEVF